MQLRRIDWCLRIGLRAKGASIDETAHLLAGLPVKGTLESLTQNSAWQGHAAAMDKAWKTKEYFQLGPIASWMSSHAGEYYRSSSTDVLHV